MALALNIEKTEELDLITRAKDGDIDAFEMLIEPHLEKIYNIAFVYSKNADDASDLSQDALVKALANIRSFRSEAKFSTWLITIARNCIFDLLKKRKKLIFTDVTDHQVTSSDKNPEQGSLSNDLSLAIKSAMSLLPLHFAEAIELVDIQEMSYQEAAQIMDIEVGTLKSRLSRARKSLAEILEKRGIRP